MNIQNTNNKWFTEVCTEFGTAFSLELNSKLHEEQSPYQKIEIYDTKCFGKLLVIDGFVMLSERDNFIYHEMMTHPALFSHSTPRHVAIVGGGDCGTLKEVAKHLCVEKITQVEIDERVTRLSEQFFPELCASNHDARVQFEFCDAIEWMRRAPAESIDIIIVDCADPIGPAEGLFQKEFYQNCLAALSVNGLIIQQSESPLIHWDTITRPMRLAMQSAGFAETKTLFFPQPVYPTGWWSATLGGMSEIRMVRDVDAKAPEFTTNYYNFGVHLSAFSSPAFLQLN